MEVEIGIALAAAGMLVVALAAALGPRLRVPAPLILVVLGVAVSALPGVPSLTVPPELVLSGILPPLLYSAAVTVPAMELRRESGTVGLLSVGLVVVSALATGGLYVLLVPGLPYGWAVALGAVISPTDAVATSIVKQATVSPRITAILEGEGLLNDASALVLLRAAIAGAAATVSVWAVAGRFAWAVVVAVALGVLVGRVALWVRARLAEPTVTTVVSLTVPFAAALPAEALGGSGLVAAVAAGLVVGRRAPRVLGPQHRRSDRETWATVALVLEGAVFLLMGLGIAGAVADAGGAGAAWHALGLAAAGLAGVLLVRVAVVGPMLGLLHRGSRRSAAARSHIEAVRRRVLDAPPGEEPRLGGRPVDRERFTRQIRGVLAGIDYLAAHPLGLREGAVVVWAGMRGAVTVAAVQTLPLGAEGPAQRPLLVLVAFGVAGLSLLLQGGSLALLIRVLAPRAGDPDDQDEQRAAVGRLVRDSADTVPARDGEPPTHHRRRRLEASRTALLDARDLGVHDSGLLAAALAAVDATQITLDLADGSDDGAVSRG